MNGGALLTGLVAAGGGWCWLRYVNQVLATRSDVPGDDADEPEEYTGPLRHFSTGYLHVQRWVAIGIVGLGAVLVVLALLA